MKIAVIGATGLVGNATVLELAARGHQVTAFARNVAKVAQHPNVTAVAADVNVPDFASKLAGLDAVVSAFNAGWDNPNLAQDVKTGYDNLLAAFKTANLPYYLIVGGAGSLNVAPNVQLVDTPDFPADVYPAANALRVLLNTICARAATSTGRFYRPPPCLPLRPCAWSLKARIASGKMMRCSTPMARLRILPCPIWRQRLPMM